NDEHLAADWREEVIVQAAVEDFAAEQVHEDAEAAEEDYDPHIQRLKDSRKDIRVLAEVARTAYFENRDQRVGRKDQYRCQREQVHPQPSAREERFAHFEAQYGGDLGEPQRLHLEGSSCILRKNHNLNVQSLHQ